MLQAADGLEPRVRQWGALVGALLAGGEVAGSSAHARAAGGQAAGAAAAVAAAGGSRRVLQYALNIVSPAAPSCHLPGTAVHRRLVPRVC